MMVPLIPELAQFRQRFDVEVSTLFNMTEVSCPIVSDGSRLVSGTSCGRAREGYQVRVVDAQDDEVPRGQIGELVVRADAPWVQMSGYWRQPAKTVESWRNQWFHTGDAFICDEDGNFVFVERMNDVIRRRGENISSTEIEQECLAHPEVSAAAAVGVPSKWGDHEVKLVVVPVAGRFLAPAALLEHLAARLPPFMVPRYVEVVAELPMTPTQKVQKAVLRAAGVTPATHDGRPDRDRPT
jgi:crotonobetaine/carnitine-CoA ligase